MKKILLNISILVLALATLGGCATKRQLEEVRATAESAQSAANSAAQRADSAMTTANRAMDAAQRAQAASDAAAECCNANTSRLDRMFEKAMQK